MKLLKADIFEEGRIFPMLSYSLFDVSSASAFIALSWIITTSLKSLNHSKSQWKIWKTPKSYKIPVQWSFNPFGRNFADVIKSLQEFFKVYILSGTLIKRKERIKPDINILNPFRIKSYLGKLVAFNVFSISEESSMKARKGQQEIYANLE